MLDFLSLRRILEIVGHHLDEGGVAELAPRPLEEPTLGGPAGRGDPRASGRGEGGPTSNGDPYLRTKPARSGDALDVTAEKGVSGRDSVKMHET